MSWLDGLMHRVHTLLRPGAHTRDLDAEMGFHADPKTGVITSEEVDD